uniref:Uncharacterized protein n=4 Tax=Parascaris univalens TaxID=6257 RepID=A0A915B9K2_PARUN
LYSRDGCVDITASGSTSLKKEMVLLENAAIMLMSTALPLMAYATFIAALAQCKPKSASAKKGLKNLKETELKKNTSSPDQCMKLNPIETSFKSPKAKPIAEPKSKNQQVEKMKKNAEVDEDEERQVVEDIRPKRIARNAKEERIAKGKEMRGKGDYPTMDDVLSDWDSEKDGKERTPKVNDDQETRTNLEDGDDDRRSKSTMDQTTKPEGPLEEPIEKNNDEIPIAKEIVVENSLTVKDTQLDDEGKDTRRTEGRDGKFEMKSSKRLLKSAKEKCEPRVEVKQEDSPNELEVCLTQMSSKEKRASHRSLNSTKRKASSIGNARKKSEQRSKERNKTSFSTLECATQETKRSRREGNEEKRPLNEWNNKVMDTAPEHFGTEFLVTAIEKLNEKSINDDNSRKGVNSRTSRSKMESSEREGSAMDNKEDENKEAGTEDEEIAKQGENILHTLPASDMLIRTGKTTFRKMADQEVKSANDDITQVAENGDF